MEAETIQKNATSSKSLTSRRNFLNLFFISCLLSTAMCFVTGCDESGPEDETEPAVIPSVEELIELSEQSYSQVCAVWLQIDGEYSTGESRSSLTSATPILLDFWQKSYECIHYSNLLLEELDFDGDIPEDEKRSHESKVLAYRATAYFYLKTLFGGIPVTVSSETSANSVPRASEQEVNDLILADFYKAIDLLPSQAADTVYLMLSVQALQISDFERAKMELDKMRNSELYGFTDVNNDGVINATDRNAQNILYAQILLLSAEASLNLGHNEEAIQTVNIFMESSGMAPILTQEEIRTAIRSIFATWNDGLKFLNAARWGDTEDWEHRALLPVPRQAMEDNPDLMQNPGW
jgi:hypothetical protein